MATNLVPKSTTAFFCEKCNYTTSRKSQFDRHISTAKHKKALGTTILVPKGSKPYRCDICKQTYEHHSSLWKHQQKCQTEFHGIVTTGDNPVDNDVVRMLIKENRELKDIMMEVVKNGTHNNITNTHTNSHNKSFNLNFFLNEKCKDAMNIMDFVESLQLQLADLEKVGENGYVEGLSNIIVKNLQALDVYKRPIHSSDSKREIIYVKDEDKWERDYEDKPRMKKAIKHIAHKNSQLLFDYKEKFPDCVLASSAHNDIYNKLMLAVYDGTEDNENRVIRKITKEVGIDKLTQDDDNMIKN